MPILNDVLILGAPTLGSGGGADVPGFAGGVLVGGALAGGALAGGALAGGALETGGALEAGGVLLADGDGVLPPVLHAASENTNANARISTTITDVFFINYPPCYFSCKAYVAHVAHALYRKENRSSI